MCISLSCVFGRKVCFQPDVEHVSPSVARISSCRSDCGTGVPVSHAGFETFFFFLIPLVLNLELSKLQERNKLHQGYPTSGQRLSHGSEWLLQQHSSRVWESVPADVVPSPRQLLSLLKPPEWQPERQKSCTKSVILRNLSAFILADSSCPQGRKDLVKLQERGYSKMSELSC